MNPVELNFQKTRSTHWDRVSNQKENPQRIGAYYQDILRHYYMFLMPSGSRILELGCGHGDLLASLQPSFGTGIDFSKKMIQTASKKHPELHFIQADSNNIPLKSKFDFIILSDLVNDLWDAQSVFNELHAIVHAGTRLVLNFYNNLWRVPLALTKATGLGSDVLEQNWFSPHDVFNLLELSGFEVINRTPHILLPLKIRILTSFTNRYLAGIPPFSWFSMTNFVVARPSPGIITNKAKIQPSVSVIVAARNESGNIEHIFKRLPALGRTTELIFVEGNSQDNTYETIERIIKKYPETSCRLYRQPGQGKGDAVRLGFEKARGDILMILDADMTVRPEDLPRFLNVLLSGKAEFVNGVRLVYPMQDKAMRFFNLLGNRFFSLAFSWLLGQPIKDTLCGTKVLWKRDYNIIAANRNYFGNFDPFGDFDLLFGAAKLNLKIADMPIRYQDRKYGDTNINRWKHGVILFRMVVFAAKRIKFI